jgi:hypothetical protein
MKSPFCIVALVSVIILVSISLKASTQVETGTGTLVILDSSQDEIVVAADSRMHVASTHQKFDNRCKVTALGNELIFAASGTTYAFSRDGGIVWDVHTIARDVFVRLSKKIAKEPMPLRLANAWGDQVKEKLNADLMRNPQETLQGAYENTLVSAIFAGFYEGSPLVVVGEFTFKTASTGQIETEFSFFDVAKGPTWEMIGNTDIAYELFEGRSSRAHQWSQDVNARIPKDGDPLAFKIIDAVRFSMENYPLVKIGDEMFQPIGGPIDAVRLKRKGGIEWIQRKQNCPSK